LGCIDIDKKRSHYNIRHRHLYNLMSLLVVPLVVQLVVPLVVPLVVLMVDLVVAVYNKGRLHLFLRSQIRWMQYKHQIQ
jgi:hypothetical protein